MSIRLTNKMRDEALSNLRLRKIQPKIDAVLATVTEIARTITLTFYPPEVQKWIDDAPKDGLPSRTNFRLEWKEKRKDMCDNVRIFKHELFRAHGDKRSWLSSKSLVLKKPVKMLALGVASTNLDLTDDPDNLKKVLAAIDDLDKIQELQCQTRETVRTALYSCNTIKQLEENYPELLEFLPNYQPPVKAMMIPNDQVVKALANIS